ncbi:MAG TPA: PPOX class F420-dependent oxidoreductase, partial [Candidatus Methylomirabilis sp.]
SVFRSLEEDAMAIPENFKDLFGKKAFAHLGTVMPDGSPQVTPVWCDFDGTHIRINSAKGRVKDKNMRRDARVALALQDPDNAYRYLQVRGKVVDITENGADDHIDSLAKKYLGKDKYPNRRAGEVRVTYKIKPERSFTMG